MLLLDSCFVVEVIQEFSIRAVREEDQLVRNIEWMVNCLQRDLMLFENQLPFFVILKMLDLIVHRPNYHHHFIFLTLRFFSDLINGDSTLQSAEPQPPENLEIGGIKHLLGMIHDIWLTSKQGQGSNQEAKEGVGWQFTPSASKLREAGVNFEKVEGGRLFDITFKNGVIRIPQLRIDDRTECFLRNLIAYEQYEAPSSRIFVTDYAALLDSLINTKEYDVELLSNSGILHNWLGDDEVVSNIFNQIFDSVIILPHFHYAHFCNRVNTFYKSKMNRWMAKLKRNYLNSPWAVISIVAAIILLLLTVTQTVIAILSI